MNPGSAGIASSLAAAPAMLGRYRLIRVLGGGSQATVWLAHDARLERDVAVKLMHAADPAAASGAANGVDGMRRLHEARSVARLVHPHIVALFEAELHAGRPCFVFEYVAGPTLAQFLRARTSPLPPRQAVSMMIGVLDAIAAAHASGLVHRELRPSNILVGADGRARVMDFGIAAFCERQHEAADDSRRDAGPPGYLSPEAARGEPAAPAMDIYAAGLVLGEMLSGGASILGREPRRPPDRAANGGSALPWPMPAEVDDALRAIVLRAVAHDAAQRTQSAAAMRDALQAWLLPALAPAAAAGGSGALDFLLRKMRHKSDFPALSEAIARIQRVASSDSESLANLAAEILKDVALTNKLLRVVNTAHYTQVGAGGIGTVTRAIALIGFAGIRNLALGLVLLDHMHNQAHAHQLQTEFLRAQFAGSLASRLGGPGAGSEDAYIGALLQNLGRLLTQFYFPEEAHQIDKLAAAGAAYADEAAASIQVLGMSYEELGVGVARSWGLPESLQRCMRKPLGEPPRNPCAHASDRLRWIATAANEIAATLVEVESGQAEAGVGEVAQRYCGVLGIGPRQMLAFVAEARADLARIAPAIGLVPRPGSAAQRLIAPRASAGPAAASAPATKALEPAPPQAPFARRGTDIAGDPGGDAATGEPSAAECMTAGIQEITQAMVESHPLDDVLRIVLETMLRALRLERIVLCVRDPKSSVLAGRFGLGAGADDAVRHFQLDLKADADLFATVCRKCADTLITDAAAPRIASRLPRWYLQHVNAPAFLLLPLAVKGAPFGLIYADKAGGFDLEAKEMSLLRTLRNQAVMAFRHAG